MLKQMISVKTVVAIGIGSALMFVLMRFAQVPTGIPNTTANLGIPVLAAFAAVFGPIAGFLIGFIGHTLVDLTAGWGIWWSWILGSAFLGGAIGAFWKFYKVEEGGFGLKECLIFNGVQIVANALAYVIIARTLDLLIYSEPFGKITMQGFVAAGANAVTVLILGSLLLFGYSKTRTKTGSLKAE